MKSQSVKEYKLKFTRPIKRGKFQKYIKLSMFENNIIG